MKANLVKAADYLLAVGNRVSNRETRRWSIAAELLGITLAALVVLLAAKVVKAWELLKGKLYAAR
jgi:hypothetical protein